MPLALCHYAVHSGLIDIEGNAMSMISGTNTEDRVHCRIYPSQTELSDKHAQLKGSSVLAAPLISERERLQQGKELLKREEHNARYLKRNSEGNIQPLAESSSNETDAPQPAQLKRQNGSAVVLGSLATAEAQLSRAEQGAQRAMRRKTDYTMQPMTEQSSCSGHGNLQPILSTVHDSSAAIPDGPPMKRTRRHERAQHSDLAGELQLAICRRTRQQVAGPSKQVSDDQVVKSAASLAPLPIPITRAQRKVAGSLLAVPGQLLSGSCSGPQSGQSCTSGQDNSAAGAELEQPLEQLKPLKEPIAKHSEASNQPPATAQQLCDRPSRPHQAQPELQGSKLAALDPAAQQRMLTKQALQALRDVTRHISVVEESQSAKVQSVLRNRSKMMPSGTSRLRYGSVAGLESVASHRLLIKQAQYALRVARCKDVMIEWAVKGVSATTSMVPVSAAYPGRQQMQLGYTTHR